MMAPVFLKAAKGASVPVAVHLDHGLSYETCARAIGLGFGSVMFDGSGYPLEENIRQTRGVVRMAHAFGTNVEAELVGWQCGGGRCTGAKYSRRLHGCRRSRSLRRTDWCGCAGHRDRQHAWMVCRHAATQYCPAEGDPCPAELAASSARCSGTSDADFKACIHHGIGKINVATALQVEITKEIRLYLSENDRPDYMEMKRRMTAATKHAVSKHILLFESDNRA